jgi:hypothetical protein
LVAPPATHRRDRAVLGPALIPKGEKGSVASNAPTTEWFARLRQQHAIFVRSDERSGGCAQVAAIAGQAPLAAMPGVRGMCTALLLCIVCPDQSCMILKMQAKDAGLHARSIMKIQYS